MKVLTVFGTRPEAIKMAPVVAALRETPGVSVRVCVTGQHRTMLDSVLRTFAIVPDDDLAVMSANQGLSEVFAKIMVGLDPILAEWKPDFVLVQGDTVTSTAGALAAFFRKVRVGHVEAGLRTGDIMSPWPEEANRRLTAVVADRHYAPTERARQALLREGYPDAAILTTGNTVIDALLQCTEANTKDAAIQARLQETLAGIEPGRKLVLVTGHRRESFGRGIEDICTALGELARRPDVQILYPVHLNPNVKGPVMARLGGLSSVRLVEPVDYPDFVALMSRAHIILTDSGGIQEEAPALRKPVLVMRDTSERPEAIDFGVARLVGTDPDAIVSGVSELLDDPRRYAAMANGATPYGDGHASARIVADLLANS